MRLLAQAYYRINKRSYAFLRLKRYTVASLEIARNIREDRRRAGSRIKRGWNFRMTGGGKRAKKIRQRLHISCTVPRQPDSRNGNESRIRYVPRRGRRNSRP